MSKKIKKSNDAVFYGLGRRKSSIARVRLVDGSGKITINKKSPEEYFPNKLIIQDMELPLILLDIRDKYDIEVKVCGGGYSGKQVLLD